MCGRFTGLSFEQMLDIAKKIAYEAQSQQMELPFPEDGSPLGVDVPAEPESLFADLEPVSRDAFPGSVVPVAAATPDGIGVFNLNWGYRVPWQKGPVFNARIETATSAQRNMWADSLMYRRCLVATPSFYEPSATETITSPRTGKPIKRQYRFSLPGGNLMFLAGVYQGDCFSVMTCVPNRWVESVHPRMPIALRPDEAPVWLSADYASLFDRSALAFEVV